MILVVVVKEDKSETCVFCTASLRQLVLKHRALCRCSNNLSIVESRTLVTVSRVIILSYVCKQTACYNVIHFKLYLFAIFY